jgi:hypothetical protein
VVIIALASGLWALGRVPEAGLVGPMMAICIAGAWVTVPETDNLVVLVGAAIPMGLVTLPPVRAKVSAGGALALAGVFAFLVLDGGVPRPWTVASSWAMIATIPVLAAVLHTRVRRPTRFVILAVHVVYVVVTTRIADVTESDLVILVSFLLLITLAALVLALAPGWTAGDVPLNLGHRTWRRRWR